MEESKKEVLKEENHKNDSAVLSDSTSNSVSSEAVQPLNGSKEGNTSKTILIVCGVILLLIICCIVSCIGLTSVGVFQSMNLFNQVANEVNESVNFDVKVKDVDIKGEEKDIYVLTLDVTNNGTKQQGFNTLLYLSLEDDSGESFIQSFNYSVAQKDSLDVDIEPGETITGKIAFSVDKAAKNLELLVKRNILDDNPKRISLN